MFFIGLEEKVFFPSRGANQLGPTSSLPPPLVSSLPGSDRAPLPPCGRHFQSEFSGLNLRVPVFKSATQPVATEILGVRARNRAGDVLLTRLLIAES